MSHTSRKASLFALALAAASLPIGASSLAIAGDDAAVQAAQKALETEDPSAIVAKAKPGEFKPSADPAVEQQANGMWLNKDGNPTPTVATDGTPGWFVFSGYRRYGANCLVCHGPDALGSTYAPALIDSLKVLSYEQFLRTVSGGKQDVSSSQTLVMPAFGANKNVQCYINDIYVYIRARSLGLWGREQPSKHEPKPKVYADAETACLGF